jgi:hypothetical protein
MHGFMPGFESQFSVRRLLQGAAAGFVATAPMSICMVLGWRLLPHRQQYPLAPRLITEEIVERVGMEDLLHENEMMELTTIAHFGYGALFGAVYGLFDNRLPVPASLQGTLAGLAVWTGSYLGWLPAAGILSPATQHPWRRNLLMILAHVVWGVTLGELVRRLTRSN